MCANKKKERLRSKRRKKLGVADTDLPLPMKETMIDVRAVISRAAELAFGKLVGDQLGECLRLMNMYEDAPHSANDAGHRIQKA